MKLEEAIKHCKEKAENLRNTDYIDVEQHNHCLACAEEHEQLANWLKELLIWRQNGVANQDCFACKQHGARSEACKHCEFEPLDELR